MKVNDTEDVEEAEEAPDFNMIDGDDLLDLADSNG